MKTELTNLMIYDRVGEKFKGISSWGIDADYGLFITIGSTEFAFPLRDLSVQSVVNTLQDAVDTLGLPSREDKGELKTKKEAAAGKLFKLSNGDYLILKDITSILFYEAIVGINYATPCGVAIHTGLNVLWVRFPDKEKGESEAREYMDFIACEVEKERQRET